MFTNSASTNLDACVKGTNVHSSEKCVDLIVVFLILFYKREKKNRFSSISCAYVHAPLLLQACHRLVHWRYYNAGKSGRREHVKSRQQCIVPMTPREPRERTRRTKDETGPVTLAQKCLRYKKKRKKRYNTLGIWESSVDSREKSTQHLCFHLSFLQERL